MPFSFDPSTNFSSNHAIPFDKPSMKFFSSSSNDASKPFSFDNSSMNFFSSNDASKPFSFASSKPSFSSSKPLYPRLTRKLHKKKRVPIETFPKSFKPFRTKKKQLSPIPEIVQESLIDKLPLADQKWIRGILDRAPIDPIVRVKPSSLEPPQHKNSETFFKDLCERHIMNTNLEWVHQKTCLQKDGCNIYLIGEEHNARNYKCTGIYEMFESFLKEIHQSDIKPLIHVMLEVNELEVEEQSHVDFTSALMDKHDTQFQLSMIRKLFYKCIKHKNCDIKVHWADPNKMAPGTGSNFIRNTIVPRWITELQRYTSNISVDTDWTDNPLISSELDKPYDYLKILTQHSVVTKEIHKASMVNPHFTLRFCKELFAIWARKYNVEHDYILCANYLIRDVMDFYTAARIIKSNMKNVVVYAGNKHTNNLITIFTELGFSERHTTNTECI